MTPLRSDLAALVQMLTPALKANGRVPKRYSKIQKRDLARAFAWNSDHNIVGFGVGPKRTMGKADPSRQSLLVMVVKKMAESRVDKSQRIPRRLYVESLDRRFQTDVVEVGMVPLLQASAVLRPGTNAAHFTMTAGSISAAVVSRGLPKRPFVLSCCHVFAPSHTLNNPIESPPDVRPDLAANHVANVADFVPLVSGGNIDNEIDAALGTPLLNGPGMSNDIPGVGRLTSSSPLVTGQFLANGVRDVFGVGAISGRVDGEIIAEPVVTRLMDPSGQIFLFQNVVAYQAQPATQFGDSGMPIVRGTAATGLQLLGMHIGAGPILGTNVNAAFFVPIAPVLDRFKVDLVV